MMNPFQMMEQMEREIFGHQHPGMHGHGGVYDDGFFNRGSAGPPPGYGHPDGGGFGSNMRGGQFGGRSPFEELDRMM